MMMSLFIVNACLMALTFVLLDVRDHLKRIAGASERIAASMEVFSNKSVESLLLWRRHQCDSSGGSGASASASSSS